MKRYLSIAIMFAIAAIAAVSQEKLPEYGNLSDLKGLTKVYVIADSTDARKFMLGEIKKYGRLEVVSSPDAAEFILDCKQNGHVSVSTGLINEMPTFEMVAYTLTNSRKRIAWSETKTSLRPAGMLLTRDFIKALKKDRGEKN